MGRVVVDMRKRYKEIKEYKATMENTRLVAFRREKATNRCQVMEAIGCRQLLCRNNKSECVGQSIINARLAWRYTAVAHCHLGKWICKLSLLHQTGKLLRHVPSNLAAWGGWKVQGLILRNIFLDALDPGDYWSVRDGLLNDVITLPSPKGAEMNVIVSSKHHLKFMKSCMFHPSQIVFTLVEANHWNRLMKVPQVQ